MVETQEEPRTATRIDAIVTLCSVEASIWPSALGLRRGPFNLTKTFSLRYEIRRRDGSPLSARTPLSDLASACLADGYDEEAHLISAIDACEKEDAYEAGLAFFRFLSAVPEQTLSLVTSPESEPETGDKLSIFVGLVSKFCAHQVSPLTRPPIAMEAIALAAARHLCLLDDAKRAQALVHSILSLSRQSIHLRAAEHAIGLLLKGAKVPPALQKFVGTDNDGLCERFCPIPFARADIHQNGAVVMCCTHWLPTSIGNVFSDTTNRILNSQEAKSIRKSVIDGSFKYCSHADCEMILNDKLPYKRDFVGRSYEDENFSIDANVLTSAFEGKSFEIDHVSFLTFCLDRTCNLTCPSCRTELIMVKGTERDALYKMTEDTVLPMVKGAKRIMVNPAGEVFVSRPSRRLLEALSQPGYENVVVDIITNGTVCTEEEWRKFQHLFGRINFIRVSVDAASKAVFEKLRRGAKYETLLSNLHTISDMHKRGYCKNFLLSFTYQRDNVEEMEAFVEFGRSLGVSTVIFERLQNVGAFTSDDYLDRAVHLIDHPLHGAFLKAVHAVKGDPKVYIDFS
jgi:hypothetical protein